MTAPFGRVGLAVNLHIIIVLYFLLLVGRFAMDGRGAVLRLGG